MQLRFTAYLSLLAALAAPRPALAALWEDATAGTIGATQQWSNKVELADLDGDGLVDILLANGAGYSSAEGPELSRALLNRGPGVPFEDVSEAVFGAPAQTRVLKVRDVDGDGAVDIFMGNSFGEQSRLYLGDGQGGYTDATDRLPQKPAGVGDLELGDVDGDGDLDAVLADWGPGDVDATGAVTMLWLNDGAGNFSDATATNMPDIPVSWSWELELADVDNDYDLDVLVSCKTCPGSFLFHNDGAGVFTDASDLLPQFGNNYEFEAIDLTGDGFVDLITINDGPQATEHILVGDGAGGFVDATDELWPDAANVPGDDNMVAFLDHDSDGDPDFVVCGLFGNDDRLLVNDGAGHLTLVADAFDPANSQGSLGVAVADLDGDRRLDVVFSEGEAPQDADRVFLGVDVAEDTAAPKISLVSVDTSDGLLVRAHVHDDKTPVMPHDFVEVVAEYYVETNPGATPYDMTWYGEALWRVEIPRPNVGEASITVCAEDAAGNRTCSESIPLGGGDTDTTGPDDTTGDDPNPTTGEPPTGEPPTTGDAGSGSSAGSSGDDATSADQDDGGGCGCRQDRPRGVAWLLALGTCLLGQVRRRRHCGL
jgi:hypothetical protein